MSGLGQQSFQCHKTPSVWLVKEKARGTKQFRMEHNSPQARTVSHQGALFVLQQSHKSIIHLS